MPEAQGDEGLYLNKLFSDMKEDEIRKFVNAYRARRKDPQMILITCLLGLLGFAGIHRFLTNQIGMGILYFLTAGLCMIGTIVDLVNHKDLAFQHNRGVAQEIKSLL
ncbi:MAG: TM2 domain-containing protein [Balneola sp.]|nr:MAG: TM2 domain-containing protein [Balneola sp.]